MVGVSAQQGPCEQQGTTTGRQRVTLRLSFSSRAVQRCTLRFSVPVYNASPPELLLTVCSYAVSDCAHIAPLQPRAFITALSGRFTCCYSSRLRALGAYAGTVSRGTVELERPFRV